MADATDTVTMLSAREAGLLILQHVERQPALRMPLDEALECVLAEAVVSPINIPFHANSAMDGYAVRAVDVQGASPAQPVRLRVVDKIAAGARSERAIDAGECARIFTGAPLPEGADSVIRQEDTDQGDDTVRIMRACDAGLNLRRAGEDIRAGETVLRAGTPLGPAELGVLAAIAAAHPMVYRRPRVAILGSGDEIADVDQPDEILSGRKVASSNSHTLAALVRLAGGEPVDLGIARDTPESLRAHLGPAFDCDFLITSAGISVGEHDHLRAVLEALGTDLKFWRLRMRPGAPVGFGMLGEIPWLGLPGNPVSAMVTFELFARPAIRKMRGHALPFRRGVEVTVTEPIALGPTLQHFLRVIVTEAGDRLEARLTGPQGSGILTSMARANALLIIPEGQHETPAGATATAIRFDDPVHDTRPPY
jgi:molybdopterin molybdotransferase